MVGFERGERFVERPGKEGTFFNCSARGRRCPCRAARPARCGSGCRRARQQHRREGRYGFTRCQATEFETLRLGFVENIGNAIGGRAVCGPSRRDSPAPRSRGRAACSLVVVGAARRRWPPRVSAGPPMYHGPMSTGRRSRLRRTRASIFPERLVTCSRAVCRVERFGMKVAPLPCRCATLRTCT